MLAIVLADTGWDGHMWGAGVGWMWLVMALFWGGLIALVVWLVVRSGQHDRSDPNSRAREILAERYARGDIDSDEYGERLERLR